MATPLAETTINVSGLEELDDSPEERWDEKGFNATRRFKVPGSSRMTLAGQLMGDANTMPHRYPNRTEALCRSVEIKPFINSIGTAAASNASTVNVYDFALVVATYAELSREGGAGGGGGTAASMVEERIEPTGEFISLPATGLRWASASGTPLKDAEAPGKLITTTDWVYTRRRLPFLATATYTLMGRVNNATIKSKTLGWTFPAETLLYSSVELSREIFASGPSAWSATMRFTIRPDGWNKFWNAAAEAYQIIWDTRTGKQLKPYSPANFLAIVA